MVVRGQKDTSLNRSLKLNLHLFSPLIEGGDQEHRLALAEALGMCERGVEDVGKAIAKADGALVRCDHGRRRLANRSGFVRLDKPGFACLHKPGLARLDVTTCRDCLALFQPHCQYVNNRVVTLSECEVRAWREWDGQLKVCSGYATSSAHAIIRTACGVVKLQHRAELVAGVVK